ncbi:transcriptional regulator [Lactobacillus delbrueckii]|uniref:transcriptional regulator n=2 Tax=Lactobacillus delbrueckii TaxID=1584 RepID=UPI003135D5BA|nr:transcriptional regulator [Lactobacillus delbrueckii subsp. sunkii]
MRVHGSVMAPKQDDVPSYLTRQKILSPVKLAMAEKANLNQLRFTKEQQGLLTELTRLTRRVKLSFVYLSPLNSISQFSF